MFFRVTPLLLAVALLACSAQEHDLLAGITSSTGQLIGGIAKLPLVRQITQMSGDLLAGTANLVTTVPLSLVRSLGISYGFPTLVSDTNSVEVTNRIINEFTEGLSNEDINLTITDLVSKYGYPIEKHMVETQDGYFLTMHRIPNDNASAVFLMHGLLGSSDDWVVSGPVSALAYLLADEGYDVWMGNARGNKHSRFHNAFDTTEADFWDFSWHEIGFYDLPAMINYVLLATRSARLKYIGHSQGTTAFFVMASERPDYNNKISLMIALSPVAFMNHVKSPIVRLTAPGAPFLHNIMKGLGLYEVLPDNAATKLLRQLLCRAERLAEILCTNFVFLTLGFDFEQLNVTNLPVLYGHMPSGASGKQFAHYAQGIVSGDFRQFDYGDMVNTVVYGEKRPPSYVLENVRTPVAMFYSEADWLADPRDVDQLYNKLTNVIDLYKVPYEHFSHLDFIVAKDFKTLIYSRIRKLLWTFQKYDFE
ncbi:PREDICTED: lipase 3-like [Papilio xuthus]|uniref:Lipase 3-like n=1 Tax=Papilio xuthus TaxID=66420 RepID=A0AAJ6Z1G9_PAPXU|nr:PREDICTED: lipase 3-like [Papilio xuthus]